MSCATHECTTIIEPTRIKCEKLGWIKCHKNNIPINKNYRYLNMSDAHHSLDLAIKNKTKYHGYYWKIKEEFALTV